MQAEINNRFGAELIELRRTKRIPRVSMAIIIIIIIIIAMMRFVMDLITSVHIGNLGIDKFLLLPRVASIVERHRRSLITILCHTLSDAFTSFAFFVHRTDSTGRF